jgi:hypothetical protein
MRAASRFPLSQPLTGFRAGRRLFAGSAISAPWLQANRAEAGRTGHTILSARR